MTTDETTALPWTGTGGSDLVARPAHRDWLLAQATGLIEFFRQGAFNPAGGFFALDGAGRPLPP
ncbi:MAG: AGE family epimerase/isomerase, partial [Rhodobacteraceae bacterium]|nr:AGE family epimerase/isomerase [Paracoccaceae bacterium]